jgi:hypothetical protein
LLDPNQIFRFEWLQLPEITLEVQLVDWYQKEFVFRLPIKEKIERVRFLVSLSERLIQSNKRDKAKRICLKVSNFFSSKDASTNFCEEDELSAEFMEGQQVLDQLKTENSQRLEQL